MHTKENIRMCVCVRVCVRQTHETWCGVLTDVAYQISWCGVLKFGTPHQKGVTFPDVAYGKIVFPDMA